MRTVIFDLDGTLADTSGDLIAAANAVLTKQGCGAQLDFESDRLLAFQGGREMLRMGLKRAGRMFEEKWVARTGYDMFIKEYEAALSVHTILYPECEESLAKLAETGWRLGVCTNKPETLARMLLMDLGVMNRFGALIGADTLAVRKPHPEPLWRAITEVGGIRSRALLVGDTDTDFRTARAAQVPIVMTAFGPQREIALSLEPDALIEKYSELPEIASRLCGSA